MNEDKSRKTTERVQIFIIILLFLLTTCNWTYYFILTHFLPGTTIEGVSCSYLTLEEAIEKINSKKKEEVVTFKFSNGKTYDITLEQLNIQIDENRIAQFFEQQHSDYKSPREYELDGFISVDAEVLRKIFSQISELQEENMVDPKDAYIIWDEVEFSIQKEEFGNRICIEDAFILAMEKIVEDEKQIDFSPITDVTPEIL